MPQYARARRTLVASVAATLFAATNAIASPIVWSGESGTGLGRFFDGNAWVGGVAPADTDAITFGPGQSVVILDNDTGTASGIPSVTDLVLSSGAEVILRVGDLGITFDPYLLYSGELLMGAGTLLSVEDTSLIYTGSGVVTLAAGGKLLVSSPDPDNADFFPTADFLTASQLTIAGEVEVIYGQLGATAIVIEAGGRATIRSNFVAEDTLDIHGTLDTSNNAGGRGGTSIVFHPGSHLTINGDALGSAYFISDYGTPGSGFMQLSAGSSVHFDIAGHLFYDEIYLEGDLIIEDGAVFVLNFIDGFVPSDGDQWVLITAENQLLTTAADIHFEVAGAPPELAFAASFDLDRMQVTIRASVIPEPGALAVLPAAGLLALRRRR